MLLRRGENNILKEKVLMVILDGFSSNYLQKELCPNLYGISKEHYFSKLTPMFGYQGVGAAIYSGASPNRTGVFTEFILERNKVVTGSRLFQALLRLTDVIPDERLCGDIRYVLFKMFGKNRPSISNVIPSRLLTYFSPKIKKEFSDENSLDRVPTIFDILKANGMSYDLQKPSTRTENGAIRNIVNLIKKGNLPDLMVVHLCSLDIVGHKFGPYSSHVKCALKKMDKLMYGIIQSARFSSDKIIIIILSDHGMCPVNYNINLLETLNQLPIMWENDYLVFLDSTMARFWFFNERARELISEALSTLECGRILRKYDLQKLGMDNIGREYGDLIFALEERYIMFPDFFRKYKPPRGMHGYAFATHDAPILIIYAPNTSMVFKKRKAVRHIDIMPTILESFNLRIPQSCEGVSLLN